MADHFAQRILKCSLALISQNIGFHSASTVALDVLLDVLVRHLESISRNLVTVSQHFNRTEPVFDDLAIVFQHLGCSVESIVEFMEQVVPFPVCQPVKLNFDDATDSGAACSKKPDYVPSYMPFLTTEKATKQPSSSSSSGFEVQSTADASTAEPEQLNFYRKPGSAPGKRLLNMVTPGTDMLESWDEFDAVRLGLVKPHRVPKPLNFPPAPSAPAVLPSTSSAPGMRVEVPNVDTTTTTTTTSSSPHCHPPPMSVMDVNHVSTHFDKTPLIVLPPLPQTNRFVQNPTVTRVSKDKHLRSCTLSSKSPKMPRKTAAKEPPQPAAATSATTSYGLMDDFVLQALNNAKVEACISSVVEETHQHKLSEQQQQQEAVAPPQPQKVAVDNRPRAASDGSAVAKRPTFSPSKPPAASSSVRPEGGGFRAATASTRVNAKKSLKAKARTAAQKKGSTGQSLTAGSKLRPSQVPLTVFETNNDHLLSTPSNKVARREVDRDIVDGQTAGVSDQQVPVSQASEQGLLTATSSPTTTDGGNKVAKLVLFKSKMQDKKKRGSGEGKRLAVGAVTPTPANSNGSERQLLTPPKLGPLKIKLQLKHSRDKEKKKKEKKAAKLRVLQNLSNRTSRSEKVAEPPPRPELVEPSLPEPLVSVAMPEPKVPKLILKLNKKVKDNLVTSEKTDKTRPKAISVFKVNEETGEKEVGGDVASIFTEAEETSTSAAPCAISSSSFQPLNFTTISSLVPGVIQLPTFDEIPLDLSKPMVGSRQVAPMTSAAMSPPPKSPSTPQSRSPPKSPAGVASASSPVPPTPSPRSSTPSSPIHVDVVANEVKTVSIEALPGERKYDESPPRAKTPSFALSAPVSSLVHEQPPPATKPSNGKVPKGAEEEFADDGDWLCPACLIAYKEGVDMVACDGCDNWFHWDCVGLVTAPPENENWYCKECVDLKCTQKRPTAKSSLSSKSSLGTTPSSKRKKR